MTDEQCDRICKTIAGWSLVLMFTGLMCTTGIIYAIQWAAK